MEKKDTTKVTRRQFMQSSARVSAALALGAKLGWPTEAWAKADEEIRKTRSYHPQMEYRRLGKTGLWVSAISLGGHWKRINKVIGTGVLNPCVAPEDPKDFGPFLKNRQEVIHHCLEVGINCIDLAGDSEAEVYCRALGKKRDQIYVAYSHPASELRVPENRTAKKLLELFEKRLGVCKLEYVDIWRLMALERGGNHSQQDVDAMVEALETARKQGKCRFTGCSTHDRKWAKMLIETYPDVMQVVVTPYTAHSKVLPRGSFFEAVLKHDVGVLGIKPFASNSIFKGDGSPDGPHVEEDDNRARLVLRHILNNPAITAPIPGLISIRQVDNAVKAVQERRKLDVQEKAQVEAIGKEMHACLPEEYQWLKDWEYV